MAYVSYESSDAVIGETFETELTAHKPAYCILHIIAGNAQAGPKNAQDPVPHIREEASLPVHITGPILLLRMQ